MSLHQKGYEGMVMNGFGSRGDVNDHLGCAIFIWGAPRSGTTLLCELITRHPDVGYLGSEGKKPQEGTGFWWRAFGEHRGEMNKNLALPGRIKQIRNEYSALLRKQGKSRLLDKTPFMTLWIQLVNEVFPEARHLHIIRDGRAVVNSILYKLRFSRKEKDQRFCKEELFYGPHPLGLIDPMSQSPAQRHTLQWILLVEQGRKNAELLSQRYWELRYEDLVAAPRTMMKKVFSHALLPYGNKFIDDNYPLKLENRNYKWKSDRHELPSDGVTGHRALKGEDMPFLETMNPLLRSLGYA